MICPVISRMFSHSDLAAPLGISVPTLSEWLKILEITGQINLVPPYFENFGKRLVKSPKLYFGDSGLACHLLGIASAPVLKSSPFVGPLFEGFVASEIIKHQVGSGRAKELYFFRDQQGLEVDFVVPAGHHKLLLVEAKASVSVLPSMAVPLERLAKAIDRYKVEGFLAHRPSREVAGLKAVRPGIQAGSVGDLLEML